MGSRPSSRAPPRPVTLLRVKQNRHKPLLYGGPPLRDGKNPDYTCSNTFQSINAVRFANSLRLSVMSIKAPAGPDGLWLKQLPGCYHVVRDHKR